VTPRKIHIGQYHHHYFFLFLTILFYTSPVVLWHSLNNALPTSDAVTYLSDAFESYININGPVSFLHHFYFDRGWRPQMFPKFALPFLFLSHGDALFTVAVVSIIFSLIFIVYLYLLLRLKLSPALSFLGCLYIGTCAYLFNYNLIFFSEVSYIAFIVAAFYHLLRSDYFAQPSQGAAAGIFFGLALCIRPAEATMFLPVILYFALTCLQQKKVTAAEIWAAVNLSLTTLLLLFYITYVIGFHKGFLLPFLILIGFAIKLLRSCLRVQKYNFFIFILALNIVLFTYWLPSVPRLINWSIEASVGDVVKSLGIASLPISALIGAVYDQWKSVLLPLFVFFPLALLSKKRGNLLPSLTAPLLVSCLLMTVVTLIMFTSVVNDGQVARRTLSIVILLCVFMFSFVMEESTKIRIIPVLGIGLITVVSYLFIVSSVIHSTALSQATLIHTLHADELIAHTITLPDRRAEDKHITLMRILKENAKKYGLIGQNVSMELVERGGKDSWDTFTGLLAARIVQTPFHVVSVWVSKGQDSYEALNQKNAHFILVDDGEGLSDSELANASSVNGKFTASLISEYRKKSFARTKLVDVINVNGRKIVLLSYP